MLNDFFLCELQVDIIVHHVLEHLFAAPWTYVVGDHPQLAHNPLQKDKMREGTEKKEEEERKQRVYKDITKQRVGKHRSIQTMIPVVAIVAVINL